MAAARLRGGHQNGMSQPGARFVPRMADLCQLTTLADQVRSVKTGRAHSRSLATYTSCPSSIEKLAPPDPQAFLQTLSLPRFICLFKDINNCLRNTSVAKTVKQLKDVVYCLVGREWGGEGLAPSSPCVCQGQALLGGLPLADAPANGQGISFCQG